MPDGPKPLRVVWSITRSLLTVRAPRPHGSGSVDHERLRSPLHDIDADGTGALAYLDGDLRTYTHELRAVEPDQLTRDEALAFWINLYNACALILAGVAQRNGDNSVLRVPGGFQRPVIEVAGERLSLDDIEHAKLRRFGDPRIHAALVCGSVSCPTLRREPYTGPGLTDQLDEQLTYFLASGGSQVDRDQALVTLSRVFLWFGADFVRPRRMPTFLPARRSSILASLLPWMDAGVGEWVELASPRIEFGRYDWGLRCAVR